MQPDFWPNKSKYLGWLGHWDTGGQIQTAVPEQDRRVWGPHVAFSSRGPSSAPMPTLAGGPSVWEPTRPAPHGPQDPCHLLAVTFREKEVISRFLRVAGWVGCPWWAHSRSLSERPGRGAGCVCHGTPAPQTRFKHYRVAFSFL